MTESSEVAQAGGVDTVIATLLALGIEHEIIDCDPGLADTAEFRAHYRYAMDESANAIVVKSKSETPSFAMCLVLATTQLDVNKTVRKRLGARKASFAPPDETADLTGMTLGGVTPFGKPNDLPLWIDSRVMDCDRVIVGGGSRDKKVYLPPSGLLALPTAEVVEDLARVPAG